MKFGCVDEVASSVTLLVGQITTEVRLEQEPLKPNRG